MFVSRHVSIHSCKHCHNGEKEQESSNLPWGKEGLRSESQQPQGKRKMQLDKVLCKTASGCPEATDWWLYAEAFRYSPFYKESRIKSASVLQTEKPPN